MATPENLDGENNVSLTPSETKEKSWSEVVVEAVVEEVKNSTATAIDSGAQQKALDLRSWLCPTVKNYAIDLNEIWISSTQSLMSDWMVRHNVTTIIKQLQALSAKDISTEFWLATTSKDQTINNLYSWFLTQLNQLTESLDVYVREKWITDWKGVMWLLNSELSQKILTVETMIATLKNWTSMEVSQQAAATTNKVKWILARFFSFDKVKSVWKWVQIWLEWDIHRLTTLQEKRSDVWEIVTRFQNFWEEVKDPFADLIKTEAMLLGFKEYMNGELKEKIRTSTDVDEDLKWILISEIDEKFIPHVQHYIWLCDLSIKTIVALVKEAKENAKRLALGYERSVFTLNLSILTTWSASQVKKAIDLTKQLWEIEQMAQEWIIKWLEVVLEWGREVEALRASQITQLKWRIIEVDKRIEAHNSELLKIGTEIKKNWEDLSKMIDSGHQKDLLGQSRWIKLLR